jgi:hypothetical protein
MPSSLDEMIEAEPDTAVFADTDRWNSVVHFRALKTVHGSTSQS